MAKIVRQYKDNLFRMVFQEKKELLSLYNALNGTNYQNPEELRINTLENAVYANFKNDISFILGFEMSLYEHQSTFNPNMPLRNLFYTSRLLEAVVTDQTLYASTIVQIPTPRFVVFYNGVEEQPEKVILKLSDAYMKQTQSPELELLVTMLNINSGHNQELLKKCKTLMEYMCYVQKVRKYAKEMEIEEAVNKAVDECIEEEILKKFFIKYRAEVVQMSIFEYDEEKEMIKIRRAEYEVGWREGHEEGDAKLIHIIRRKLERNMVTGDVAELLELEEDYVEQVAALIGDNPQYTDLEIARRLCQV